MSPRRGRGGRGQRGIKGTRYPNRSDLAFNARAPTVESVPPSATYGAGAQQQDVIRSARAAQEARAQPNPVMQAAEAFVPPQLGALDRPTERPNEPLTAGMSQGAGPGPEVLPFQQPSAAARVLAYLASLPTATENVRRLAAEIDRPSPPSAYTQTPTIGLVR